MPDDEPSAAERAARRRYFQFILASTAMRSFEAGIVAVMMPQIREDLRLSYTHEGVIASAPDFGIVPAGLLAIGVFERRRAHDVLVGGNAAIALSSAAVINNVVDSTAPSLAYARTSADGDYAYA